MTTQTRNVGVQALIPEAGQIRLFGYTGPYSKVIAEGPRAYGETLSDNEGYFVFETIAIAQETKEICLYSIDYQNRSTYPNCIPISNNDQTIGPVLLPPTISLSPTNVQIETSGQTIPEAEVKVVLSKTETSFWSLIPQAQASILPKYTIKADQNGNYSFNMPESPDSNYRLFTISDGSMGQTPKSQTLTITFENQWILVILIIILSTLLLLYALRFKLFPKFRRRHHPENPHLRSVV